MMYYNEYYKCEMVEKFEPQIRYIFHKEPISRKYLRYLRRAQFAKNSLVKKYYAKRRSSLGNKHNIEIFEQTKIGKGFYIGHPGNITINPAVILGEYVCIHKGATIGVENRGRNKGVPVIGDCVWIGINAMIFGNIHIGNDVLISPNSVVNCDVPSHSVVFGNPCVIKSRCHATEGYISMDIYLCVSNK